MNWETVFSNPWVIGIGGSIAAALLGWLVKRIFRVDKGRKGSVGTVQNASPVVTQNFQPTINIRPRSTSSAKATFSSAKATFQAAQELDALSTREREARRVDGLEIQLHQLILSIRLIHTDSGDRCSEQITSVLEQIKYFFNTNQDRRHLNVDMEVFKAIYSDNMPQAIRRAAVEKWGQAERSGSGIQHPCEALGNEIVEDLLKMKVRPNRTMRDYDASLPR